MRVERWGGATRCSAQGLLLVLGGPYVMPGRVPVLDACKANALPVVLSLPFLYLFRQESE